MSRHQKRQILQELGQLRRFESNLQARFETLGAAESEARSSFLNSLEEWKRRAQFLDNLLDRLTVA